MSSIQAMLRRLGTLVIVAVALALVWPSVGRAAPGGDVERWALVIGVDRYQGRTPWNVGSAGDAHDVTTMLRRNGWPAGHIITLTDEHATAANIRAGMRWLEERSSDRSFSVFHYSGHIKRQGGDLDGDGEDVDEYLWPHDNVFVADLEVAASLTRTRGWLWANFSGCHAAGMDDGIASDRRLVTASSQEPEKSYDHPEWRNSVHSGLMVDQGMLQGHADADGDGTVSIDEGFRWSADRAPVITSRQRSGPQHPYRAGGGTATWFLRPPPPEAPQTDGEPRPEEEPAPDPPKKRCTLIICFG